MDNKLAEIGVARASVDTDKGKDHLYVRGLTVSEAGEDEDLTVLSDHPAIYLRIEW